MEDEELNNSEEEQDESQGEDQGEEGSNQNRQGASNNRNNQPRRRKSKKKSKKDSEDSKKPESPKEPEKQPTTQTGSKGSAGVQDKAPEPKPSASQTPEGSTSSSASVTPKAPVPTGAVANPAAEAARTTGQGIGEAAKDAGAAGQSAATGAAATAGSAAGAATTTGAGAVQAGAQAAKGAVDTGVAAAETAATTAGVATEAVLVTAEATNPVGWALLAAQFIVQVVVPSIIVFALFIALAIFGSWTAEQGRTNSLAGGTIETPLNPRNATDQKAVSDMVASSQGDSPKLLVAAAAQADLDWQTNETGDKFHRLDRRTVNTINYLSSKWEVLGIKTLVSNGPEKTYRKEKIRGKEKEWEAASAYATGQAVAIDKIGLTSQALADACFGGVRVPVEVSWQKANRETFTRPIYEQLWVDAATLQDSLGSVNNKQDVANEARKHLQALGLDNPDKYIRAEGTMDLLIKNLALVMAQAVVGGGMDARTALYAGRAHSGLNTLLQNLRQLTEEEYITEWQKPETKIVMEDAIRNIFKSTQVVNKVGYRQGNCEQKKAYEAGQNIRALEAQVLYMPIETATPADKGFNRNLVVKQMIVYSPEDDLDNGLKDLDVFPNGGIIIDEGGIAFKGIRQEDGKLKVGDGKADYRDEHSIGIPIDNGIFSKASTVYLFKKDDPKTEVAIKQYQEDKLDANLMDYYNTWDGALPTIEGYEAIRVSYKNFVHIGF